MRVHVLLQVKVAAESLRTDRTLVRFGCCVRVQHVKTQVVQLKRRHDGWIKDFFFITKAVYFHPHFRRKSLSRWTIKAERRQERKLKREGEREIMRVIKKGKEMGGGRER